MKIEWNRVTWYSKLAAAGTFIVVFFVGFLYGIWYEKIITRPLERELEQKREIVNWLDRANLIRAAERRGAEKK